MKYRILAKTGRNGNKKYYVQARYLFFFWRTLRQVTDRTMRRSKVKCKTLEEAEDRLRLKAISDYARKPKKKESPTFLRSMNLLENLRYTEKQNRKHSETRLPGKRDLQV